jgi:hypothetical protein
MPVLADRLGTLTSAGIEDVADKLSRALQVAGTPRLAGLAHEPMIRSVSSESRAPDAADVPTTKAELEAIVSDRPKFWEYLLFAGTLVYKRDKQEPKWRDHQLRFGWGERRFYPVDRVPEWLDAERSWLSRQFRALDRVMDPAVQERAFGLPGEPGKPEQIEYFAGRIIGFYESLMDWAASLRHAAVTEVYEATVDAQAALVDQTVLGVRNFIDRAATDFSRLSELEEQATDDNPIVIRLTLQVEIDEADSNRFVEAFREASRSLDADES